MPMGKGDEKSIFFTPHPSEKKAVNSVDIPKRGNIPAQEDYKDVITGEGFMLVYPIYRSPLTSGGILIPQEIFHQTEPKMGVVVACDPNLEKLSIKYGSFIIYGQNEGREFLDIITGESFELIHVNGILIVDNRIKEGVHFSEGVMLPSNVDDKRRDRAEKLDNIMQAITQAQMDAAKNKGKGIITAGDKIIH